MKDIVLRSFQELGIAGKNLLNCIRNPIAYATTCYDFQNYNKYFLISYWYDTWRVLDKNFIEEQNSFLDYLNIELKQEITQDQDLFIHMIQNHIDQDQPVFIFLDYYNIFYNKTFYKKEHIPHGIIITGYDETNHTFGLRERIIINPDGLYDFQLTEDMMYDMWEASCETLRKEHKIYYFQKYNNAMSLEIEEILQNLYLEAEQNTLIRYIQKFDTEFTAVDGFILRRQYDATVYFFELLEKIILSNALVSETEEFAKKYLEFINLFINKTIKNMMIGEISKNKMEKEIKQLLELDHQLFTLIDKILSNYQSIKNVAYQCKVTASSMVESDIAYSPDKTVNGKYSDEVMLQNHWVSNNTDKVHWITYDLGKKWPIRKIVLYHIKCNVLVDYMIQGSNDNQHWDILYNVVNNQKGSTSYYLKGQSYQFLRVYITNPSTQGTAARIVEFQAWA